MKRLGRAMSMQQVNMFNVWTSFTNLVWDESCSPRIDHVVSPMDLLSYQTIPLSKHIPKNPVKIDSPPIVRTETGKTLYYGMYIYLKKRVS
ncbi:unnamed protein product [Timema podura]|uniref:Uncharacterized protein n=1 Tax=Timema podura TaxID=61482 RepID=A0ABN7NYJ5_TIMPD|nr:unnamed protein product [Timema podura]